VVLDVLRTLGEGEGEDDGKGEDEDDGEGAEGTDVEEPVEGAAG
jgi:hypothetical protein